ncbi:hypothetical protein BJ508DRAFT_411058 [Ascobolus immersus RN42]|uniref:YhhN-like protein n=1 Tax=Ascobolus immersus RN42 TaxID=1160509 RepID=A0A3N4IL89_ASCIM|nr:hypothetical protein BJ508DRAFT_411058 [Ascobolus immersus RN42]
MAPNLSLPPAPYPQLLSASVAALIASEVGGVLPAAALSKSAAALSFLAGGIRFGLNSGVLQLHEPASIALATGLAFSVVGDVLLIPSPDAYYQKRNQEAAHSNSNTAEVVNPGTRFKAGTAAFALAHIAYTSSFLYDNDGIIFSPTIFAVSFGSVGVLANALGLLGGSSSRALIKTKVPKDMKWLVRAYIGIIATMVATATASVSSSEPLSVQKAVSAWMFAISDCFVAADAFGVNVVGTKGRAIGWMLYFGAQLGLSGCI